MQLSRLFRPFSRLLSLPRAASRSCSSSSSPPSSGSRGSDLEHTILNVKIDGESVPAILRNAISLDNASRSEKRRARKWGIVERFRRSDADTGSPEVQIAIWSDRIRDLTEHLHMHRQDKASKRRMVMMVNKRRRMMRYLLREDSERYEKLVSVLGLRRGSVFGKEVRKGAKKAPARML